MGSAVTQVVPRSAKVNCTHLCEALGSATPQLEHWAQHPGLIVAFDGLTAYASWVSRIVLPIVFQWIEENKPDVYAKVPKHLHDDVGAVVRAAFDIVKRMDTYKNGQEAFAKFQEAMEAGTWDPKGINPSWSKTTKNVRRELRKASQVGSRSPAKAKRK